MKTKAQERAKDRLRPRGPITRIIDETECDRLIAQACRMMSSQEQLSPLMIRKLGWVAVLVPEVVPRDTETRILAAARRRGVDKMSVVCTGPIASSDEPYPQDYVYELDLTDVDSSDFFMPPSHPFLYFPNRHKKYPTADEFALMFGDEGEHYTISGSRDFVEEALGKSVEEARADFQGWIDDEDNETFKAHLQAIADRYASFDVV